MSKTERCLVAAALATIFALVAIFILIDMASPELRLSRLSARTLEIVDVEPAGEPEPHAGPPPRSWRARAVQRSFCTCPGPCDHASLDCLLGRG